MRHRRLLLGMHMMHVQQYIRDFLVWLAVFFLLALATL